MAFSLFVFALIVMMVGGGSGKRTKRAVKRKGTTQGESSSSAPDPETYEADCDIQLPGGAELNVGRNSNFRSDETFYKHRNIFKHCTVMSERNIKVDDFPNSLIDRVLRERGWENLVSFSTKPNFTMVKEFYANVDMTFSEHFYMHCFVRTKFFKITPRSLSRFYNAPVVFNPQFPYSDETRPSLGAVASLLTGVNREWDGIASTLKHSELTPDFAVLHVFVSANLCPVLHTTTVNRDKAYLMYALATNTTIDLGLYLFKLILFHCEKSRKNTTLPFGSLITSLCRQARCENMATDVISHLGPTYNLAAYNKRMTILNRGRNAPNVGININPPPINPQPQPEPQEGNVYSMENMWAMLNNINNNTNTINTNVINLTASHNEFREYSTAQFQGLNERIDGIDDRIAHYYNNLGGFDQGFGDGGDGANDDDDYDDEDEDDDDGDDDDAMA